MDHFKTQSVGGYLHYQNPTCACCKWWVINHRMERCSSYSRYYAAYDKNNKNITLFNENDLYLYKLIRKYEYQRQQKYLLNGMIFIPVQGITGLTDNDIFEDINLDYNTDNREDDGSHFQLFWFLFLIKN